MSEETNAFNKEGGEKKTRAEISTFFKIFLKRYLWDGYQVSFVNKKSKQNNLSRKSLD